METVVLTAVLVAFLFLFTWHARKRRLRFLATVEQLALPAIRSEFLDNSREITLFLPPGYQASGNRRYPVLYLNDGQDVEALQLRYTLARLVAGRQMKPVIVVAIPTNAERLQEYGTAVTANAQGLGKKAKLYGRFVTEEIRPLINGRFRTLTDPANTAVLGASLGGLSAFDIGWNHPDLFGIVGVFSGSFWWRAGEEATQITPGALIMHEVVRRSDRQTGPRLRIWLQAGTRDEVADRDQNGVIDAIQDTVELMDELTAAGYRPGIDVVYHETTGGRHDYETWAKLLPTFLHWAFPANPVIPSLYGQSKYQVSSLSKSQ
jgi:iron(III)-enterobactin esterase